MEKKNYIKADNNQLYNISAFKKIIKHAPRIIKDGENVWKYVKVSRGTPLKTFLGFVIKRAKIDCYTLLEEGYFCHKERYRTLKELFDAIFKYYGYRHNLIEGRTGVIISKTKKALYFDEKENAIRIKPYLEFVIDELNDDYAFKTFETEKEMNTWFNEVGIHVA